MGRQIATGKQKIAFVLDMGFPSDLAGAIRVENLCRHLGSTYDISVICKRKTRELEGISISEFSSGLPRFASFTLFPLFAAWKIRKIKPDVIILSSPPVNSLPLTLFFRNTIADVRDFTSLFTRDISPFPIYHRIISRLFEKYLIMRSKRVVVGAPHFSQYFKGSAFIPNGADNEIFKPGKGAMKKELGLEGKKLILYSGSLSEYHMPDFLLEAIPPLLEKVPEAVLVFAGGGNKIHYFLKEAEKKGFAGSIRYIGLIKRKRLSAFINSADVCISTMSPKYPTIPAKIFDYISCARPVVTNQPEIGRMFSGVAVGESPHAFASAIEATIKRPPKPDAGLAKKFSREETAKSYEKVIKGLIG